MSFLNKLFGKRGGEAASAREIDSAVKALSDLYDDPEVRSDRGIAITGS
ncbi:MAG: hypothetical protein JOY61_19670, partial [Chloroflexi bacterium]|nr:hypothetical protein [Chloroflexota bacterium]MBV9599724.1 hypothetical protein [Chloroflexota bacterium]